jgi:hypothetical protein
VGATHHEEVANQLAAINTSYSNPRLFWGRWGESRWGYWWVVAAPCTTNCAAGDAKRIWHVQNLLVAFDENGVVTSKQTMTDDKAFWNALHSHPLEVPPPPLDLSQPIRISLTTPEPAILLTKDSLEFEQHLDEEKLNLPISVLKLVRFSHFKTKYKQTPLGVTCHAMELSENGVYGKKITFCAEANQVGLIFQYLRQAGPRNMRWE